MEAGKTMRVPSPQPPLKQKPKTRARISLKLVAELSDGRGAAAAHIITKGRAALFRCIGLCEGRGGWRWMDG